MRVSWLIPVVATALLTSGCKQVKPDQAESPPATGPTSRELALPVAEAPLDRAALLLAAASAASAVAIGADDEAEQQKLSGRRFELHVRFGCPAVAGSSGGADAAPTWRASFEEPRGILRLRVNPDIDQATPLLRAVAGSAFENAEGFWLLRPWALAAACPIGSTASQPVATESTTPEAQPKAKPSTAASAALHPSPPIVFPRVGVVQGFGADEPRTHRVRKNYEVTRRLTGNRQPSTKGYDLVLAGRLRRLPSGKVIACRQDNPQLPPDCLISAEFDRIAFLRGDDGEQIAEWTGAGGI